MKATVGLCLALAGAQVLAATQEVASNAPLPRIATRRTLVLQDSAWATNTQSSDCVSGQGDDVWQLTLSRTRELRVTASDISCPGDYFEIFIDGRLTGTTPNLAPPWGCLTGGGSGPN